MDTKRKAAEWVLYRDEYYIAFFDKQSAYCSNCGHKESSQNAYCFAYCPNCGAEMYILGSLVKSMYDDDEEF